MRWMLGVGGVVLVVAVSGCGSDGGAMPSASDTSSEAPSATPLVESGAPVTGVGSTGFPGVEFPLAAGARSVTVAFECEGGTTYSVEIGDSMALGQAPLEGACDGETVLAWPITDRTGPTLSVMIPDGVAWTATPTFSADEFAYDEAVEADCDAFSAVYSELTNADVGYTHYKAIDAADWAERVEKAEAGLNALVADAESSLGEQFAVFEAAVTDPGREVGQALTRATQEPFFEIHRTCNVNQTPLIVMGEFGG